MTRRALALAASWAALTLLVAAPLALVQVPGLGDYLNHLARMHVLATLDQSAALQRYYTVSWAPIPYLAMDAIVPVLSRVMPVYLAGKLFIGACLLLPPIGCACLHYAVHRRASFVPLAAFLTSYNYVLSLGFLNFLFSAGCALLLLAAWIATRVWPRWCRVAAFAPAVTVLYLGHVFACLAYCLAVAGWEIGRAARAGVRPRAGVALDVATAAATSLPAALLAARLDVGSAYVGTLNTRFGSLSVRFVDTLSPLFFTIDAVQLRLLAATLAVCVLLLPRLRLAATLWPAVLLVGLVALCMPHVLDSTWGTDLRLPLVTAWLAIASLSWRSGPSRRGRALRLLAIPSLFVLVGVKSWGAARVMHDSAARVAETRRVLTALPVGARLLVVDVARGSRAGPGSAPSTDWQTPLVAVIDRDAFVPYFFNGLTTVHLRPAYHASSTPNGFPITPAELWDGLGRTDQPGLDVFDRPGGGGRLYHFGWPDKFDYVLVQKFGLDPGPLPPILLPVAHSAGLDLYRIGAH